VAGQNPKFQQRPENGAQLQFSKMAVNVSVSLCESKKKNNKSPGQNKYTEHIRTEYP
jgi:hypothetical protein